MYRCSIFQCILVISVIWLVKGQQQAQQQQQQVPEQQQTQQPNPAPAAQVQNGDVDNSQLRTPGRLGLGNGIGNQNYPNAGYPGGTGYPNQNYPGGGTGYPNPNYPGGGTGYPNPNYPGGGGTGYPNNPNYPGGTGYPDNNYPGSGGGSYPGGGNFYPGGMSCREGSWCMEKVTPDRCMREEDLWNKCPRTCNTCQCADIDPKCRNVQTDQRLCLDMRIKYLCRKSCNKCFSGIGIGLV